GPILECGSGLTTFLLAFASRHTVWSLEHLGEWQRRIPSLLNWTGTSANLLLSPLQRYGSDDWYAIPAGMPSNFRLVVCDGPPGSTLGGRYGLMPVLGHKLQDGATILLDDADRPEERSVLEQWEKEAGWGYVIKGDHDRAYAIVT